MTIGIDAGWKPQPLTFVLSADQDFTLEIEPDDPTDIPDGTTVALKIYPPGTELMSPADWPQPLATWPAEVADGIVAMDIPFAQEHGPNTIPDKAFARLVITYPDTDGQYCWAKGPIKRDD